MHPLSQAAHASAVLDHHIPATVLEIPNADPSTGEHVSIPCYPHFHVSEKYLGQVASVDRYVPFIPDVELLKYDLIACSLSGCYVGRASTH